MIASSLSLFCLSELPFSRFDFPRWRSALAITILGLGGGLISGVLPPESNWPAVPMWVTLCGAIVSTWAAFLIIVCVLRAWMKRDGRWDGQGNLFNLVATSWLVADLLGIGLTAMGVPLLATLLLWLYSVWVGANALSSAIPKASIGYSIGGIAIGLIPAIAVTILVYTALGVVLAMLGIALPLPPIVAPAQ
ncbi:hypothetical protein F1536_04205 [Achromobacter xylosoxidans]|uniref:hypothetical protein n=1 Tax=Alcaligenes xylosoxydans xylosoxydans TaxID=85698 RepID=UPI0012329903|nr:hypothetical protein [Achromobacter xylosoxidans]KAA5924890.1 hypothetical protein F1536_04205 [Achromobacter xylosoxidans]MBK1979856.1 hypothetical protein [Achromobacter xylosoxidans]MCZ8386837.1 hypothetical protein [Achromobacter xylosoxidans]